MKILVVRHGYAGEPLTKKENLDAEDAKRELTPVGKATAANLAQWCLDNDWAPSVIRCSPVIRVVQTAQIIAKILLGDARAAQIDLNLGIQNPLEQVVVACARDAGCSRPMLVTHSDTIPRLSWLNGDRPIDVNDPPACGELRIIRVSRDDFTWKEKKRVLPSDLLGAGDGYDDAGAIDLYAHAQR